MNAPGESGRATWTPPTSDRRPRRGPTTGTADRGGTYGGGGVDGLVTQAQEHARCWLTHWWRSCRTFAAWREGLPRFGAKPQRTRNSLRPSPRRAPGRSAADPLADRRVQRDLRAAPGADRWRDTGRLPRPTLSLIRATRGRTDRLLLLLLPPPAGGETVMAEHPKPGEVVWRRRRRDLPDLELAAVHALNWVRTPAMRCSSPMPCPHVRRCVDRGGRASDRRSARWFARRRDRHAPAAMTQRVPAWSSQWPRCSVRSALPRP